MKIYRGIFLGVTLAGEVYKRTVYDFCKFSGFNPIFVINPVTPTSSRVGKGLLYYLKAYCKTTEVEKMCFRYVILIEFFILCKTSRFDLILKEIES